MQRRRRSRGEEEDGEVELSFYVFCLWIARKLKPVV
jgi:hypothetical protein